MPTRRAKSDPATPREPARGGRITALTPQTHDPDRLNVFLDGAFAFGLPATIAAQARLEIGQILSLAEVIDLQARDAAARATDAAVVLLAHRPRSIRELEQRLRQKSFPPDAIAAALTRLGELNYIDDTEFARYWVTNRQANRPRGRRLLEQELRQKGVDRSLIAEAIDEAALDEPAAALAGGRAKLRTYAGLEPAVARRRLAAYLTRRGYDYDTVRGVLTELFVAGDDADADALSSG